LPSEKITKTTEYKISVMIFLGFSNGISPLFCEPWFTLGLLTFANLRTRVEKSKTKIRRWYIGEFTVLEREGLRSLQIVFFFGCFKVLAGLFKKRQAL
jgi:hypothetical protein